MAVFHGDWETERLQVRARLEELWGGVFADRRPVGELWCCVTGMDLGPDRVPEKGWRAFQVMERWGGLDQTTWIRMTAVVPPEFAGRRVVALLNP
ncbi:MAG TPA: hypothetical protein P5141_11185, partial [Candidatus Hydrogenedentes bacterium]|nr:hypothetical protein [Candidatus Hydrogenedentota bacterium]